MRKNKEKWSHNGENYEQMRKNRRKMWKICKHGQNKKTWEKIDKNWGKQIKNGGKEEKMREIGKHGEVGQNRENGQKWENSMKLSIKM